MVIDTSVLIHIAFEEDGWRESLRWLSRQPRLSLSAFSLVEAHAVIKSRSRADPEEVINALLETLAVEVIAFDAAQAQVAHSAYTNFGKGRGHPAKLNLGDVVTYALAASRGEVLAFVGEDFDETDLEVVSLPRKVE